VASEDSCDPVQAQNWSKARTIIVALIVLFPLFSKPVFGMARISALGCGFNRSTQHFNLLA
jgi:hypothetical protein